MRIGLLHKLDSMMSGNERLIELYRSIYYLLPVKEQKLSKKILLLLEKREELELKLKKCSFHIRNSVDYKQYAGNVLVHLMPFILKLENLARLKFKGTRQNEIYLEEKNYLKKYFELLYNENLSESVFELLLKYKRRQKSFY
jgi:hypothetical protein